MRKQFAMFLMVGVLVACGGGGGDNATAETVTVSRAEFEALMERVALLEQRVNTVKSGSVSAAVRYKSYSTGPTTSAEPTPATEIGTLVGFNNSPTLSTSFILKSSTGYLFSVDNTRDGSGVAKVTETQSGLWYETFDCTGTPYIQFGTISDYGAAQGTVVRVAGPTEDVYAYVPSGTLPSTDVLIASHLQAGECLSTGTIHLTGYAGAVNDPQVTGVQSAPLAQPLTIN